MSDAYLDTDVLIRLISGDDPRKQQAATVLFQRVGTGELRLRAPATVIADAVFVLGSPRQYAFPRSEIRAALLPLLRLPGFDVAEGDVVRRALDVYVAHPRLDFSDAMTVAAMQLGGATELYAYDHDFDRVPGINRREPGQTAS